MRARRQPLRGWLFTLQTLQGAFRRCQHFVSEAPHPSSSFLDVDVVFIDLCPGGLRDHVIPAVSSMMNVIARLRPA